MKLTNLTTLLEQIEEQPALMLNVYNMILDIKMEDLEDHEGWSKTFCILLTLFPSLYEKVDHLISYLKQNTTDSVYLMTIDCILNKKPEKYQAKLLEFDNFDFVLSLSKKWTNVHPCTLESLREIVDVPDTIILTPTIVKNINLILCQLFTFPSCPLLIVGSGCASTTILKYIYSIFNKDYVPIYIANDTDLKDLIGFYMCTNTGVEYLNGPISDAFQKGEWLTTSLNTVHRDVSQFLAKTSIFQKFETDKGMIHMHPNYRIICTIDKEPKDHAFKAIHLTPIPDEEYIQIFDNKYSISGLRYIFDCYLELDMSINLLDSWLKRVNDLQIGSWQSKENRIQIAKIGQRLTTSLGNTSSILAKHFIIPENQLCASSIAAPIITRESLQIDFYKLPRQVHTVDSYKLSWITSSSLLASDIAASLYHNQPLLLIGGTGIGKTATVSEICRILGLDHTILNFSPSTERQDLIGSWKPTKHLGNIHQMHHILNFLTNDTRLLENHLYKLACDGQLSPYQSFVHKILELLSTQIHSKKRFKSLLDPSTIITQLRKCQSSQIALEFQIGPVLEAYKSGSILFLDEINLAPSEVLESLATIISAPTIKCPEVPLIHRHPDFKIIAAMNPQGDVGKKSLPKQISDLFINVVVMDPHDLPSISTLVSHSLSHLVHPRLDLIIDVISKLFYQYVLNSHSKWLTFNNCRPIYSIRTLKICFTCMNQLLKLKWPLHQALLYGFNMAFLVCLNTQSELEGQALLTEAQSAIFKQPLPSLTLLKLLEKCQMSCQPNSSFVLTASRELHACTLIKAILSNVPVLLEGTTGSGKTSLVTYLASITNNTLVRINNHEHVDLVEYIGNYQLIDNEFQFINGPLIQAMQQGHWLLLDELNLAPSDILESLNRLLDDNKQLHNPFTNEMITCHPNFRLFATQNPTLYGGRNQLSRAFRNRFIELHVPEYPLEELSIVLTRTGKLPPSWCAPVLGFYKELTNVTIRDVFKWISRPFTTKLDLQYTLLSSMEKCRDTASKLKILKALNKHFKSDITMEEYDSQFTQMPLIDHIAWTRPYLKAYHSTLNALNNNEPVLLVSEPGLGKSLLAKVLAQHFGIPLTAINCNKDSDSSDLLGCFKPTRNGFEFRNGPIPQAMEQGHLLLIDEINLANDAVLERLNSVLEMPPTLLINETNTAIVAHPNFKIIATMNPSTDITKRECTPALRNRMTELFLDYSLEHKEVVTMANAYCEKEGLKLDDIVIDKCVLFYLTQEGTIRDLHRLLKLVHHFGDLNEIRDLVFTHVTNNIVIDLPMKKLDWILTFTAQCNLQSLLMATTVDEPVLIRGLPGLGKSTLANLLHKSVCITCSFETDLSELIGQFTPTLEGIKWVNGPLVEAMINGYWIILDELNLAPSNVLEGLNSLLDFRRELNVNNSIVKPQKDFKLIATMNPTNLKDGRNLLSNSLRNRFIVIDFKEYTSIDLEQMSMELINDTSFISTFDKLNTTAQVTPLKTWNIRDLVKFKYLKDKYCYEKALQHLLLPRCLDPLELGLGECPVYYKIEPHTFPTLIYMEPSLDTFQSIQYDQIIHFTKYTDIMDLLGHYEPTESGLIFVKSNFVESLEKPINTLLMGIDQCASSVFDRFTQLIDSSTILVNHELIHKHPQHNLTLVCHSHRYSKAISNRCILQCYDAKYKRPLFIHDDLIHLIYLVGYNQVLIHKPNNPIDLCMLLHQCNLQLIDSVVEYMPLFHLTKKSLSLMDFFQNLIEKSHLNQLFATSHSIHFVDYLHSQFRSLLLAAKSSFKKRKNALNTMEQLVQVPIQHINVEHKDFLSLIKQIDPYSLVLDYKKLLSVLNSYLNDLPLIQTIAKDFGIALPNVNTSDVHLKLKDCQLEKEFELFDSVHLNHILSTEIDIITEYMINSNRQDVVQSILQSIECQLHLTINPISNLLQPIELSNLDSTLSLACAMVIYSKQLDPLTYKIQLNNYYNHYMTDLLNHCESTSDYLFLMQHPTQSLLFSKDPPPLPLQEEVRQALLAIPFKDDAQSILIKNEIAEFLEYAPTMQSLTTHLFHVISLLEPLHTIYNVQGLVKPLSEITLKCLSLKLELLPNQVYYAQCQVLEHYSTLLNTMSTMNSIQQLQINLPFLFYPCVQLVCKGFIQQLFMYIYSIHYLSSHFSQLSTLLSKLKELKTIHSYTYKNTLYIKDTTHKLDTQVHVLIQQYKDTIQPVQWMSLEFPKIETFIDSSKASTEEWQTICATPTTISLQSCLRTIRKLKLKSELPFDLWTTMSISPKSISVFIHALQFKLYYKQSNAIADYKRFGQYILRAWSLGMMSLGATPLLVSADSINPNYKVPTDATTIDAWLIKCEWMSEAFKVLTKQPESKQQQPDESELKPSNDLQDMTNEIENLEDMDLNGQFNSTMNDNCVETLQDMSDMESEQEDMDSQISSVNDEMSNVDESEDKKENNELVEEENDVQDKTDGDPTQIEPEDENKIEDVDMDAIEQPEREPDSVESADEKEELQEEELNSNKDTPLDAKDASDEEQVQDMDANDIDSIEEDQEVEEQVDEETQEPIEQEQELIENQQVDTIMDEVDHNTALNDMDNAQENAMDAVDQLKDQENQTTNDNELEGDNADKDMEDDIDDVEKDGLDPSMQSKELNENKGDAKKESNLFDEKYVLNKSDTSGYSDINSINTIYNQCQKASEYLSIELQQLLQNKENRQLQGDYTSGKRLNIKRMMHMMQGNPKIWLRRIQQHKNCQIIVSVDTSLSMDLVKDQVYYSISLIQQAMRSIGTMQLQTFDASSQVVLDMQLLDKQAMLQSLYAMRFTGKETNIVNLLNMTKEQQCEGALHLIISDGIYYQEQEIKHALMELEESNIKTLLVIVGKSGFIEDLQQVNVVDGKMELTRYLDTIAFHYALVHDINELHVTISNQLKQYIQ